jgi:hypothetical protein
MDYYRASDQVSSVSGEDTGRLASRYAWLEHEEGSWHFLTSLFDEPTRATRRWGNRQRALNELTKEGWVIVGAYPELASMPSPDGGGARGYGLMQVGHWTCENASFSD